ncbi:MAG: metallophosphoesterase, partial [Gammaproteobacteria bacterium]
MKLISRREFLGISTKASAATFFAGTFAPTATSFFGLAGVAEAATRKVTPFNFAIISDAHLYNIKDHKFDHILERAVKDVNAMSPRPDFVIFGGDLAQTGMKEELEKGKRILDTLKIPLKIIPGEHDWYLDMGKTWGSMFGRIPWSFNHKGVHVI